MREGGSVYSSVVLAVVALVVTTGMARMHSTWTSESEQSGATYERSVTVNGESVAIGGRRIEARTVVDDSAESTNCGEGIVAVGGTVTIEIKSDCRKEGTELELALAGKYEADETISYEGNVWKGADGPLNFELTPSELEELGLGPASSEADPDAAGEALKQQSASVFEELDWMLVALLVSAAIVLLAMVVARSWELRRRYEFLNEAFKTVVQTPNPTECEAILETTRQSGEADRRASVYRSLVEGLVLTWVVIALIALGAAGKVTQEGIVSVLAAMVGYAAGRTAGAS